MNRNLNTGLIILGAILVGLVVLPVLWGGMWGPQTPGPWTMGPWMMGGFFGWGWFMPIFAILFWVLVVWAVVALVRGVSQSGSSGSVSQRADSALEVLNRRYARGEITKEEYEEIKRELT